MVNTALRASRQFWASSQPNLYPGGVQKRHGEQGKCLHNRQTGAASRAPAIQVRAPRGREALGGNLVESDIAEEILDIMHTRRPGLLGEPGAFVPRHVHGYDVSV